MSAPLTGRHTVTIGSSLQKRSPPFVALKYNFQPGTLDTTVPATLSGGSRDGTGEYTLSVPSRDDGPNHVFKSTQIPQKEVDCLLIYDEETGNYTLEQLGSVLRMDHQRTAPATGKVLQKQPQPAPDSEEEDGDLDDLANMLESTLDESAQAPAAKRLSTDRTDDREDESSEDED